MRRNVLIGLGIVGLAAVAYAATVTYTSENDFANSEGASVGNLVITRSTGGAGSTAGYVAVTGVSLFDDATGDWKRDILSSGGTTGFNHWAYYYDNTAFSGSTTRTYAEDGNDGSLGYVNLTSDYFVVESGTGSTYMALPSGTTVTPPNGNLVGIEFITHSTQEDDTDTGTAAYTVTMNPGNNRTVTVPYCDGSASNGTGYTLSANGTPDTVNCNGSVYEAVITPSTTPVTDFTITYPTSSATEPYLEGPIGLNLIYDFDDHKAVFDYYGEYWTMGLTEPGNGYEAIWYSASWSTSGTPADGEISVDIACWDGAAWGAWTSVTNGATWSTPCNSTQLRYRANITTYDGTSPHFDDITISYDVNRDGDAVGATGILASNGTDGGTADCDDNDNTIYPGATEVCDGDGSPGAQVDDDCNAGTSPSGMVRYYPDTDGDTFGDENSGGELWCLAPTSGYSANDSDCDDSTGTIKPGIAEICEGDDTRGDQAIDHNCSGSATADLTFTNYYDDSGDDDGWGTGTAVEYCATPNLTQWATNVGDCAPTDPNRNDGETEVCDGDGSEGAQFDNDCDNNTDPTTRTYYVDVDGDGYGDENDGGAEWCGYTIASPPTGHSASNDDCNDVNGVGDNIHPDISEVCDGDGSLAQQTVDDNCSGSASSDLTFQNWWTDGDNDDWGADSATAVQYCTAKPPAPATAWANQQGDCADGNPNRNEGETEVCDGDWSSGDQFDNDCDGSTNMAMTTYYQDTDGDTYPGPTNDTYCNAPGTGTWGLANVDCDDDNSDDGSFPRAADIYPGATETYYDGVDQDCNAATKDFDKDNDGYLCDSSVAGTCSGNDCDDDVAAVNIGATEVCGDDVDNDCSGEGNGDNVDEDGDGITSRNERIANTDECDADTDDDGLHDGEETTTDPLRCSSDGDSLPDGLELGDTDAVPAGATYAGTDTGAGCFIADSQPSSMTNPNSADTDNDGLDDDEEDSNSNGVQNAGQGEPDPNDADTDDDGRLDGEEDDGDLSVEAGETNLLVCDTDNDGLPDGLEVGVAVRPGDTDLSANCYTPDTDGNTTDPADDDTDNDGILDGNEDSDTDGAVDNDETDPNSDDSDSDLVQDGTEMGLTSAQGSDTSNNFVADADSSTTTDPLNADSDNDGVDDGYEDLNRNGRVNASEMDPNDQDSDEDGLMDGTEDTNGNGQLDNGETSGISVDTDNDLVQDGTESGLTGSESGNSGAATGTDNSIFRPDQDSASTTDPTNNDTDGDGVTDGKEDINIDGAVGATEIDPNDQDSDEDGLLDGTEDADGSGAVNGSETDPRTVDSDGDGIQDGTELGLTTSESSNSGAATGTDTGVFQPDQSSSSTTDPLDADSDEDGLSDGAEDTNADGSDNGGSETRADRADSDNDGVQDGTEQGLTTGTADTTSAFQPDLDTSTTTDPLDADTDNDLVEDGDEDRNGNGRVDTGSPDEMDPNDQDSDDDGITDGAEDSDQSGVFDGSDLSDPVTFDTDGDGLSDGLEIGLAAAQGTGTGSAFVADTDTSTTTDPRDADSDDDGLSDGAEDADTNGAVGSTETDPNDADTDNDLLNDGLERGLTSGTADSAGFVADADPGSTTDPLNDDSDGDDILDGTEDQNRNGDQDGNEWDPNDNDSDDDLVHDGEEDKNHNGVYDTAFNSGSPASYETDPLDHDSDNDGLSDGEEDRNRDGVYDADEPHARMLDSDGDSVNDNDEVPDTTVAYLDTDTDGTIDARDTDDDGDGRLTITEDWDMVARQCTTIGAGNGPLSTDRDNDTVPDYLDNDDDNDDVPTLYELAAGTDSLCVDSDLDNVTDGDEWCDHPCVHPLSAAAYLDPRDTDNDTVIDALDEDDDDDGIITFDEGDDDIDGVAIGAGGVELSVGCSIDEIVRCEFRPDGIPNYIDTNSDGDCYLDGASGIDTIPDPDHTISESPFNDQDNDGVPDIFDCLDNDGCGGDADGDGLENCDERDVYFSSPYRDDTDSDGIPDSVEAGPLSGPTNTDGTQCLYTDLLGNTSTQPCYDIRDPDDDNDGVLTSIELCMVVPPVGGDCADEDRYVWNVTAGDPPNSDEFEPVASDVVITTDTLPDYLDPDDDGDGVSTLNEDIDGNGDPGNDDTDGDGIPNYLDVRNDGPCGDTDNDGLANSIETYLGMNPDPATGGGDSDGDGVPDAAEIGSDILTFLNAAGDTYCDDPSTDDLPLGAPDGVADLEGLLLDSDGDGTPDVLDLDDDGDGIDTADEGAYDVDGDGVPNYLDDDSDEDGVSDQDEGLADEDGDGVPDFLDNVFDQIGDGPTDTGTGGTDDGGEGCGGCSNTAGGPSMLWLGLFGLVGLRRRRAS